MKQNMMMMKFMRHGHHCHSERMTELMEKWNNMTDEEKLDMANKHMEMMGQDPFTIEAFQARYDRWNSLSNTDKTKWAEVHQNMQKEVSIEAIDTKWAKWTSLSDDEKQKVVDKYRKKAMHCRHPHA